MKNSCILIIDDNQSVLSALELLLEPECKKVVTINSPNQIPHLLKKYNFDAILLDMNYSSGINTGNEGIYWLRRILDIDKSHSVIMITAYGDVELAVKSVKEGAVDFVLKPWINSKLLTTVSAAIKLRNTRKEIQNLKSKEKGLKTAIIENKEIIGSSPQIQHILDITKKVAKTDANILITGENGTGKDIIANEIHRQSLRNKEILIRVDMGSLSETLFESELFGHIKGAFTDAKEDRMGKFEIAKNSTLFLDEISNLSLALQAKLLTALQTREIVRVGSNKKIPINIRLVCATNANLNELVKKGKFREDLLYRINTIQIEIPALRYRTSDIDPLSTFFLEKYRSKYNKPSLKISKKAMDKLKKYEWPGNVRELQHAIERAVILCEGKQISYADFLFNHTDSKSDADSSMTLEEMEKNMILKWLHHNDNNLSATAKSLGVTRQTLYNKIKKHNL